MDVATPGQHTGAIPGCNALDCAPVQDMTGEELRALDDEHFEDAWRNMGDAGRMGLPPTDRRACFDRHNNIANYVGATVHRLDAKQKGQAAEPDGVRVGR